MAESLAIKAQNQAAGKWVIGFIYAGHQAILIPKSCMYSGA